MMTYLIIGVYAQGSYDDAYIYSLKDGNALLMSFRDREGEEKKEWFVNHPIYLRLFSKEGKFRLITGYHNPSTAEVKVYNVWDIVDDSFVLEKTIGYFWEDIVGKNEE